MTQPNTDRDVNEVETQPLSSTPTSETNMLPTITENTAEPFNHDPLATDDAFADDAQNDDLDDEASDDLVEPEDALPEITLAELPEALQTAAAKAGWKKLMPVQAKAIPYMLAGRDLLVQSRTGSGKTGAFLLPILTRIDPQKAACQALILVPTRELAQQVAKEADLLGGTTGVRSIAIYGGVKYGPQLDALKKGAQLVIGTPGRILDHLLQRNLRLDDLAVMVFDEADRMLSMGFYPDMRELQRYLPQHAINAYMFSATFPSSVRRLAYEFLANPEYLSLSRDRVHVTAAEHLYYTTPVLKRDRSLVRLIEIENPASAFIFCNTKNMVHYVATVLRRFGYDADEISSDLNQQERDRVLNRVRNGELRFLVATDVAARGIDIPELSHVFQYEPPEDPESYIHRAGRTARAGATGVVITLIENFAERLQLEGIAKRFGIELTERPLPNEQDVTACVAERVTVLLEAQLRTRDKLKTERMQRFVPFIAEWASSEEGQSLLAMLVDDFYQQSLHAPLLPPAAEKGPQRGDRANRNPRQEEQRSSSNRRGGRRRRPRSRS
ncbi:MAG: DEAD/DEAH box helicase [Caldilineaceae bacterium]|nr:DEAD/DEAH box helicase [Caldilineaceae bacterium]